MVENKLCVDSMYLTGSSLKSTSVFCREEKSLIDWSMVMEMPCTMTLRSATLQPPNKSNGSDYGERDRRQGEQRKRRGGRGAISM